MSSKAPPNAVQAQLASLQARQNAKSQAAQSAQGAQQPSSSNTVLPAKLAKNKRLPATMITPGGVIDSKKKGGVKQVGKKQRKRLEEGKEKALERSGKLDEKVKGREERKIKRQRAKKAWE